MCAQGFSAEDHQKPSTHHSDKGMHVPPDRQLTRYSYRTLPGSFNREGPGLTIANGILPHARISLVSGACPAVDTPISQAP